MEPEQCRGFLIGYGWRIIEDVSYDELAGEIHRAYRPAASLQVRGANRLRRELVIPNINGGQFQALAVDGMNFSVCISAKADYFSGTHSFAEPAVRFYSKIILAPFTFDETLEYTQAVFDGQSNIRTLSHWLYEKTLGHPYFLAFISRELLARGSGFPSQHWREISVHLEREKFESDLAQLSEKDIALLRALARSEEHEVSPTPFVKQFQYEYFRRLTDRGLLIRSGRGRYKLYHPLFRAFLQQRT
jgi:hypothetical protein